MGPTPLLYAEPTEPQSLNKYTYALGNPLRYVDPDGHQTAQADGLIVQTPNLTNLEIGAAKAVGNIFIGMNNVVADRGVPGTNRVEPFKADNGWQAAGMIITADGSFFAGLAGGRAQVGGVLVAEAETPARVASELGNAERVSEVAATGRAARREAMREEGIPTSQKPSHQMNTQGGRQYQYEVPKAGGGTLTKIVTNQLKDRNHGPHYEAGRPKTPQRTDPGGRLRHSNDKTKIDY